MSKPLNKAILARIRGDETLTDARALAAQVAIDALLATIGGKPACRYGMKGSSTVYPEITFREDAGPLALDGSGIGIVTNAIYRFELWETTRDATTIPAMADYLELLFDARRDAPDLTLEGEGRCYYSDLFTGLQGPFVDDFRNAFFGLMAFRFVEARP